MEITEIKQKIQDLINKATEDNNRQKQTLSFLFDKLAEVKELETIDRLRQFQGGDKYLQAYFLYKQISRANYQPELTKDINFSGESGQERLLNAINADIEAFEKQHEPKPLSMENLTSRQILTMLSERIGTNEIKRELTQFGKFLIIEDEWGLLKIDLNDGKLTPDPVEKLLKKHGFCNQK